MRGWRAVLGPADVQGCGFEINLLPAKVIGFLARSETVRRGVLAMSDEVPHKESVPPTPGKIPSLSSALPSDFGKPDAPTLPPSSFRLETANYALTLAAVDHGGVLSRAFEKLGFAPDDPLHWRFLIEHLVRVVDLAPPPQINYAAQLEKFLDASSVQPAETQTSTSRLPEAPKLTAERVLRLHVATTLAPNDKGPLSSVFREQRLNPDDPLDWINIAFRLALQRFGGRKRGRPKETTTKFSIWTGRFRLLPRSEVLKGASLLRLSQK